MLASLSLQALNLIGDRPVIAALGTAAFGKLMRALGIAVEPVGALGAELRHLGRCGEVVAFAFVAAFGRAGFGFDWDLLLHLVVRCLYELACKASAICSANWASCFLNAELDFSNTTTTQVSCECSS